MDKVSPNKLYKQMQVGKVGHFVYRDIHVEVHYPYGIYSWRYYLYLHMERIADKGMRKKLWSKYEYFQMPDLPGLKPLRGYRKKWWSLVRPELIDELPWHGGCTYYERSHVEPGAHIIMAGCDYAHSFDEDDGFYSFDLDNPSLPILHGIPGKKNALRVLDDAMKTVDAFLEVVDYSERVPPVRTRRSSS